MADSIDELPRRTRGGRTLPIDQSAVALAQARTLSPRAERETRRILECASELTRLKIVRALI